MPKIDPYSSKKKKRKKELDAFEGICVIVAEQFKTILPSFLLKKKSEIFLKTAVSYGITHWHSVTKFHWSCQALTLHFERFSINMGKIFWKSGTSFLPCFQYLALKF